MTTRIMKGIRKNITLAKSVLRVVDDQQEQHGEHIGVLNVMLNG